MKQKKRHIAGKIIACLLVVIVCAAVVLYGNLALTLVTMKGNESTGVYEINYREDYKLDQLLNEGGVKTQDELARYLIRILLKGLPIKIKYEVPALACSTFVAETPDGEWLMGRNLDNQETDFAVALCRPECGTGLSLQPLKRSRTMTGSVAT